MQPMLLKNALGYCDFWQNLLPVWWANMRCLFQPRLMRYWGLCVWECVVGCAMTVRCVLQRRARRGSRARRWRPSRSGGEAARRRRSDDSHVVGPCSYCDLRVLFARTDVPQTRYIHILWGCISTTVLSRRRSTRRNWYERERPATSRPARNAISVTKETFCMHSR